MILVNNALREESLSMTRQKAKHWS